MKHIMMCFLSIVTLINQDHSDKNVMKGEFRHTDYRIGADMVSCVQTNESALRKLQYELEKKGETLDGIFYFVSKDTQKSICVYDGDGSVIFEGTHERCFHERVRPFLTSGEEGFHPVPYDEYAGSEEGIRRITAMTKEVKEYADRQSEPVCLHTDMTGGLRYASMMLLSAMQLLKYSGIHIGSVLYSDFLKHAVEDVSDVYRTFTLVSGADEFVNFGSVREISNYFEGRPQSAELTMLLSAMNRFSDDINVCRTGYLENTIQELKFSLDRFIQSGGSGLQEALFLQIADVLQKEYGGLFEGSSRLRIIRWCLDKNFLQQAMTLCTEWMPHELVSRHICYTDSSMVKEDCAEIGKPMQRTWEQAFIMSYFSTKEGSEPVFVKNTRRNRISWALADFQNGDSLEQALKNCPSEAHWIRPLLEECEREWDAFNRELDDENLSETHLNCQYPEIMKVAGAVYDKNKNNPVYTLTFCQFLKSTSMDKLFNEMKTLSVERMNRLFHLPMEKKNTAGLKVLTDKILENRWKSRENKCRDLMKQGIMKTDFPDKILPALHAYFLIRNTRNQINHANSSARIDSDDLKQMIINCIDIVEK